MAQQKSGVAFQGQNQDKANQVKQRNKAKKAKGEKAKKEKKKNHQRQRKKSGSSLITMGNNTT